uniref:Uncharacterized protein n=1 Tax=Tanacetum cinerariifolium TaxID=118510 RepID=A0A699HMY2_TANCI|nr:hypothetical protein [Tanacetum cinerariifolium]
MLLAKKDEAQRTLSDEQNDFLLADTYEVEEFKDLNATLYMMVRIQQAGNDLDNGPIYDSDFISEFSKREDKYLDDIIDLKRKIKANKNMVVKMSHSIQAIHMLGPEPNSFYDLSLKNGLGYKILIGAWRRRHKTPLTPSRSSGDGVTTANKKNPLEDSTG